MLTANEAKIVRSVLVPMADAGVIRPEGLNELLAIAERQGGEGNGELEKLYQIKEAAAILQVHRVSIHNFIKDGRLEGCRFWRAPSFRSRRCP